ncbi:hypothetical protein JD844_009954 [Phrynosoma platyrhinos]|uniref:Small-subunit processome Utp12 domain-containing protein n=1 Tax=Phrynosoma platyrhinos TaxID=52577 RepID=A0ABQ7TG14_PHRPL|nr:hypothetical protein JD844_009954 [Phrynosoma platyrhinos]
MGLTKQYLRYSGTALFGVVASQKGNIVFVTLQGERGRYVAVPACEHVFIWDTRKAEKVLVLQGRKQEATALCPSPDDLHLSVGYEDGSVRVFSLLSGEEEITFNGHKATVTVLRYDALGGKLASGSKDTDIIVWDVINESGLYRLKGHKDAITQLLFFSEKNVLISSGKDTLVKWWDLDTQHCFKTLVGHRSEVWGLALVSQESLLITGSADSELRVWNISFFQEDEDPSEPEYKRIKGSAERIKDPTEEDRTVDKDETQQQALPLPLVVTPVEVVLQDILSFSKAGSIMREGRDRVGTDSILEVFHVLSKEEIHKKIEKKMKKARKKAKQMSHLEEEELDANIECSLQEKIQRLINIKASAKIKSFDLILSPKGELKATVMLQNNKIELYTLNPSVHIPRVVQMSKISIGGHRSDVRTLAFSSDNIAILSAAAESVKIWNRVIRTFENLATGKLQLFDLASGNLLESIGAHDGALWSISLSSDQCGFVTGGADKCVRFWEFQLVKDENSIQKWLSVKQTRVLQLDEDVLCVRYSPCQKLLAVALLDCTVKIFYTDTLKFFLSLYGHKLPVLCMDISHGHHQEVWCLALSPNGDFLVSSSHDKSLRLWERTKEPLILEEEREMQREMEYEDSIAKEDQPLIAGDIQGESGLAGRKTIETIKAAERIMEAIELYREETVKMEEHKAICRAAAKEVRKRLFCIMPESAECDHPLFTENDEKAKERVVEAWQDYPGRPSSLVLRSPPARSVSIERSLPTLQGPHLVSDSESEGEIREDIPVLVPQESVTRDRAVLSTEANDSEQEVEADCVLRVHPDLLYDTVPLPVNPILQAFGNISPSAYVLEVLKKVKSSELEESLLVLPFSYVPDLLVLFNQYLQLGSEIELLCRALLFLLRIHFGQITSNQLLVKVIENLKKTTNSQVSEVRRKKDVELASIEIGLALVERLAGTDAERLDTMVLVDVGFEPGGPIGAGMDKATARGVEHDTIGVVRFSPDRDLLREVVGCSPSVDSWGDNERAFLEEEGASSIVSKCLHLEDLFPPFSKPLGLTLSEVLEDLLDLSLDLPL